MSQARIRQLFATLDLFGSPYTPRLSVKSTMYRSAMGGLISLIIYSLALSYCIYKFYLWFGNQIQPVTNSYKQTQIISEAHLDDQQMQFTIQSTIDPFQLNSLILIPLMQTYQGMQLLNTTAILKTEYFGSTLGYGGYLDPMILTKNASIGGTSGQVIFFLGICSKQLLLHLNITQGKCASQQTINQFLNSFIIYRMAVQIKQYNPQQGQILNSSNSFYFTMDPSYSIYTQLLLQITNAQEDKGILFQQISNNSFISDYTLLTQSVNMTLFQQVYQFAPVAALFIRLDTQSIELTITQEKLGNVLADIGSILKILLCLKIIACYLNESQMLTYLEDEIISFYYPEYKYIEQNYNIFGKLQTIYFKGRSINNKSYLLQHIKQLRKTAQQKLTALNIIYEISRLQFIVSSMQSRDQLMNVHKIGIEFKDPQKELADLENNLSVMDSQTQRSLGKLTDDDFELLTLKQIQDFNFNSINQEYSGDNQNFYKINRIMTL